jgi:hypothetical protein
MWRHIGLPMALLCRLATDSLCLAVLARALRRSINTDIDLISALTFQTLKALAILNSTHQRFNAPTLHGYPNRVD